MFVLERGQSLRYGLVEASVSENGLFEACDPYGCIRVQLSGENGSVVLNPVAPVYRPRQISGCLYLEFPAMLAVNPPMEVLAVSPFEFEVVVGGSVVGYLSPRRAKYTLIGDVVDGIVCRYYRSRVIGGESELIDGEAVVRIRFRGDRAVVPGVGFYVAGLRLAVRGGTVYYPLLDVSISKRVISARLQARLQQPLHRHVVHGRLMFSQSFVMEV